MYFRKVVRGAESSEDEGEGSWEKMQIRKGITGPQVPPHAFHVSYHNRKMFQISGIRVSDPDPHGSALI